MINGQISEDLLRLVGIRGSKLHHLAARGFAYIRAEALKAGYVLDLASVDPRTYTQQMGIFDRRTYGSGRYLPESMWASWEKGGGKWASRDGGGQDIRSWKAPGRTATERWKRLAGTASSAIPGTSPHGDALALDVALRWADGHYPPQSVTKDFALWMKNSGVVLDAGFHWSLDSEPWHIQWTSGNIIPTKVLLWEASLLPSTTPPPVIVIPPPVVTPPYNPPSSQESTLMLGVISIEGSLAKFVGWTDGKGHYLNVTWVSSENEYAGLIAAQAKQDTFIKSTMVWLVLLGPVPSGDVITWSVSDFKAVIQ